MHILQKKIPYIFDTPSVSDSKLGMISSLLLAFLAAIWISLEPYFDRGSYYYYPVLILLAHGYIIIRYARNILFIFRYALLSILGLGTAIAWSMGDEILIAPFGASYQTNAATAALVCSVMLAVAGSSVGWFIVFSGKKSVTNSVVIKWTSPTNRKSHGWFFLIFAWAIALVYLYRAGGVVTADKPYATGGNDLGFEFGALNSLFLLSFSIYFICARIGNHAPRRIMLAAATLFLLPILSGSRADFLMQITIILYVLYKTNNKSNLDASRPYPVFIVFFGALFLYFISTIIAYWRDSGSIEHAISTISQGSLFFQERPAGAVLSLSTANQMAGHFYAVYAKLNILREQLLFGTSYIEFIPRSIPGFLWAGRPEDLAWQMDIAGDVMAQGGIFEVAEAYWNFWYFGAFIVPFMITFIMAILLKRILSSAREWLFGGAVFMGLMLMSPRGVWYQTFAYWRFLTVALLFYAAYKLLSMQRNVRRDNSACSVTPKLDTN